MSAQYVHIQVNLNSLLGGLLHSLQRTINVVSVGLQGVGTLQGELPSLPGAWATFAPRGPGECTAEEAREHYRVWALRAGFRDHIEAINPFLEKAREVCALYSLKTLSEVKGRDWNEAVVKQAEEFHWMGLAKKHQYLRDRFDIELSLSAELESINDTRNCLVHRAGVVGSQDVNEDDALVVKWRRYALVVEGEQGERMLSPSNRVVEEGETVSLRTSQKASRPFAVGDSVSFDTQEFSEIGYTLYLYGQELTEKVQAYGERCGIEFRELERDTK